MDPMTLQMIMYGAQGLSGIPKMMGSLLNASANRRYDDYVKKRTFELENLFNNQYNQNFLDTEEAKGVIRNMLNQMKEASDNIKSSSKITGASAEKEVAEKDKMNENFSNVLTQLASMGTQRKDRIMGNYLNARSGLDTLNLSKYASQAASGNQAQQNADSLMNSALLLTTLAGNPAGAASSTGGTAIPSILNGMNAPNLGNVPNLNKYSSFNIWKNNNRNPQTLMELFNQ